MALLVAFTPAEFVGHEAALMEAALDGAADVLPVRKPGACDDDMRRLLDSLSPTLHRRIVLHDCLHLAAAYGVRGIHAGGRHAIPAGMQVRVVSRSCHSLDELARHKGGDYDYLFLSPIYDSISKPGYASAYTHEALSRAAHDGVIDRRVIALGGITPANAGQAMQYAFGGVAVLGSLWGDLQASAVRRTAQQLKTIITQASCYNS